ncbi:hypothetical protein [Natrinema sp. SYSU A 869]|uniref:hypothetical protein n=1 Tax=Natrinema sp. SYSU A 869 TaxID=2871694 RepID=UPI001CA39D58|nr:hypothetical protein [Natrinema sp. SYSU A 869]
MLEQIDHRGKRFTIDDAIVDEIGDEHSRRASALEQQAQREARELERARAVAGPAGATPEVEVLE